VETGVAPQAGQNTEADTGSGYPFDEDPAGQPQPLGAALARRTSRGPAGGLSHAGSSVPNGMRLVVEHVNGRVKTQQPNTVIESFVLGGNTFISYFAPRLVGVFGTVVNYAVNEPTLMYFEAGQKPTLTVFIGAASATMSADVTLTGYLVDLGI
jgi:hypothetical protein